MVAVSDLPLATIAALCMTTVAVFECLYKLRSVLPTVIAIRPPPGPSPTEMTSIEANYLYYMIPATVAMIHFCASSPGLSSYEFFLPFSVMIACRIRFLVDVKLLHQREEHIIRSRMTGDPLTDVLAEIDAQEHLKTN